MADDFEIKLRGFDELAKQLRELPEKIAKKELYGALREAAKPMLQTARSLAPVAKEHTLRINPGLLRRSIRLKKFTVNGSSLSIGVSLGVRRLTRTSVRRLSIATRILRKRLGIDTYRRYNDPFYWYFVEQGTKKVAARFFLETAFKRHRNEFLVVLKNRLGERIEAIWRGR